MHAAEYADSETEGMTIIVSKPMNQLFKVTLYMQLLTRSL